MKVISQADVYEAVSAKIKPQLLDGNAIVLFAYGLSGSGKTFTVFGPDAADSPEACMFCLLSFFLFSFLLLVKGGSPLILSNTYTNTHTSLTPHNNHRQHCGHCTNQTQGSSLASHTKCGAGTRTSHTNSFR